MIALKDGFNQRKNDPFMMMQRNYLGTVITIIYIDESLSIGDRK